MRRRAFLKASSLAGAAAASGWSGVEVLGAEAQREFYELRIYQRPTGSGQALNEYLAKAAIPAWNRAGASPIGAFSVVSGASSLNTYVLIPYPGLDAFEAMPAKLAADAEYQKAAAPFLNASIDAPAYARFETWLLRAFKNVPRVRVPAETAGNKPRIFELRVYESASDAAALKKIEMFNEGGEIALFDRVGLRGVFFGQTLAGPRMPNLVYLTVHQDMAAREKVWETFRDNEGWKKLSSDPAFANTVSATMVAFLRPAAFSQI